MSSLFWIFIIAAGGVAVVVGNIEYAKAKSREDRIELAQTAREVIQAELDTNRHRINEWEQIFQQNRIPSLKFEISAWNTIAHGELATSLPTDEMRAYITIYERILRANDLLRDVTELNSGSASALSRAPEHRSVLIQNIDLQLTQIASAFRALDEIR